MNIEFTLIATLVLITVFERGLEETIKAVATWIRTPFDFISDQVCQPGEKALIEGIRRTVTGLAQWNGGETTGAWAGWAVIRSSFYGSLTLTIMGAGGYVMYLRLGALMRVETPTNAGGLVFLSSVEVVAALLLNSIALYEPRMLGTSSSANGKQLRRIAVMGLIGTIATSILLLVWGQLQIQDSNWAFLEIVVIALLGLITATAVILGHRSLVAVVGVGGLAMMAGGWTLTVGIHKTSSFTSSLVEQVFQIPVAVLRAVATPPHIVWNWIASFPMLQEKLRLRPLPDLWR